MRASLRLATVLLHVCHLTTVNSSDPPPSPPSIAEASRELSLIFDWNYPDQILRNKITVGEIEIDWKCQSWLPPNSPFGKSYTNYKDLLELRLGEYWFVGARRIDSDVVTLGAFIPIKTALTITPRNKPLHISDRLYWYYNNYSYGFAPIDIIDQQNYDMSQSGGDAYRLSVSFSPSDMSRLGNWENHAHFGQLTNYYDVFYHCPLRTSPPPTPPPTSQPTPTAFRNLPFSWSYPDRILLNEIYVDQIETVWKCESWLPPSSPFGYSYINYRNLLGLRLGEYWFVGARLRDSNFVSIGAFIPVYKALLIRPRNKPLHVSNQLYWYFNNYSYGFAPNSVIDQQNGDIRDPTDPYRLSVSFFPSETSRAGRLDNDIKEYYDVFYHCPHRAPPPLSPPPTLQPTIPRISAPSKTTAAPTRRTAAPTRRTAAPTRRTAAPTRRPTMRGPTKKPSKKKPTRKIASVSVE